VELLPAKRVVTEKAIDTQNFVNIPGYYPMQSQITLQFSQNSAENRMTFVYAPTDAATYTVSHFLQQENGKYPSKPNSSSVHSAKAGERVSAEPREFAGYKYDASISSPRAIVATDGSSEIRLYYALIKLADKPNASDGKSGGDTSGGSPATTDRSAATGEPDAAGTSFTPETPATIPDNADGAETGPVPQNPPDGTGGADAEPNDDGVIDGGEVPLAPNASGGHWSLLSLIISAIALVSTVIMLARAFARRKQSVEGEEKSEPRNISIWVSLAALAGVATPVLWALLDNLDLDRAFVNGNTKWVALAFAVHLVLIAVKTKAKHDIIKQC
jgi:hypothetical protein